MGTRPWLWPQSCSPALLSPSGRLSRTPVGKGSGPNPRPTPCQPLQEPQAGPSWLGLLRWGSVCSGLGEACSRTASGGASWGQPRAWGPLPASPWLPLRPSPPALPALPRPLPGCLPWCLWPQTSSPRPALPSALWPLLSPLSVLWCLCVLPSVPQPVCPSVPLSAPLPCGINPRCAGGTWKKGSASGILHPQPQPQSPPPRSCFQFQEINSVRSALQEFGRGTHSQEPPGRWRSAALLSCGRGGQGLCVPGHCARLGAGQGRACRPSEFIHSASVAAVNRCHRGPSLSEHRTEELSAAFVEHQLCADPRQVPWSRNRTSMILSLLWLFYFWPQQVACGI